MNNRSLLESVRQVYLKEDFELMYENIVAVQETVKDLLATIDLLEETTPEAYTAPDYVSRMRHNAEMVRTHINNFETYVTDIQYGQDEPEQEPYGPDEDGQ